MSTAEQVSQSNVQLTDDGEEPFNPPCDEFPPEDDGASDIDGMTDDEIREEVKGGEEDKENASNLHYAKTLNRLVRVRREKYEESANTAKERKKLYESAQEQLNEFLDSLDQEMPLFDKKPEPRPEPVTIDEPAPGWEGTQLCNIVGFTQGILAKLEEAGIIALGQLAEFTRTNALTDIDGIGPASAEKVENALTGFWAEWNAKCPAFGDGEA